MFTLQPCLPQFQPFEANHSNPQKPPLSYILLTLFITSMLCCPLIGAVGVYYSVMVRHACCDISVSVYNNIHGMQIAMVMFVHSCIYVCRCLCCVTSGAHRVYDKGACNCVLRNADGEIQTWRPILFLVSFMYG